MGQNWIKLHADILTDPKVLRLSLIGRWIWVGLLLLSRNDKHPGVWRSASDTLPGIANELSHLLHLKPSARPKIEAALSMMAAGPRPMLEIRTQDCEVEIVNWAARQGRLPTMPSEEPERVAERARRYRERNRAILDPLVTVTGPPVTVTGNHGRGEERRVEEKRVDKKQTHTAGRPMAGPAGEVCRAFDKGHITHQRGMPYLCHFARDQAALASPLRLYGLPLMLELVEAYWIERGKAREHPSDPKYAAGRSKPTIVGLIGQIPNLLDRYTFDSKPPEKPNAA